MCAAKIRYVAPETGVKLPEVTELPPANPVATSVMLGAAKIVNVVLVPEV